MESQPPSSQTVEVEGIQTEPEFVRLTAAELGFAGTEMVEYGPYTATVDQTLIECEPISHLGPEIARMALVQGIELYKRNHPEEEKSETEEETEDEPESEDNSAPEESKKKLK